MAALWLCFLVSGAAALAAELLWLRSAGLVLGQTADTAATVLACYFGGMGIGAMSARRARRHPVRLYACLELGAACGIAWSLFVFGLLGGDAALRWISQAGAAARVAAVAVAVLPATVLFGATLPTLAQALSPRGARGWRTGLLYGANIAGGALGALAMGFSLPASIGVRASYLVAALASGAAGVIAMAASRRWSLALESGLPPVDRAETAPPGGGRRRLRVVAAGVGALGLALEVLWTRLFAQVLHNSTYSFSAIVVVTLLALAGGAALAALLLPRVDPGRLAVLALVGAAVTTIAGGWTFMVATHGLEYVGMRTGLGEYILRIVALAGATMGPALLLSGIVLPALWAAWRADGTVARPLGDLTAASTFGGVAGAVAAGFVGMPVLGVRGCLVLVAVVYVILADVLAAPGSRWRPVGHAVLVAAVVAYPFREPLVRLQNDREVLREVAEGPNGIVTVVDTGSDLQLRLDNYYILGGTEAVTSERRLGLVPLLLHPEPRHAAFIGCATGITASAALALEVEKATVIELVPEVVQAARRSFGAWNGHLLDHAGVDVVVDDGRHFLSATRDDFDVLVSDLFVPWHPGTSSLYSREMYELAASRLRPGGLFCQWLPLYQLTREELDVVVRTFLSVFPQVGFWRADFYPNRPVCGLVGQLAPRAIDLDRVSDRVARLPEWARDPLLAAPRGFIMLYAGNLTAAADLFAAAPLNTDDRPLIEFLSPRLTRLRSSFDKDWFIGGQLADFYEELDRRLLAAEDPLFPGTERVRAARRAGTALFGYAVAATSDDTSAAEKLEAEVRSLVPEVIASSEAEAVVGASASAPSPKSLLGLRAEQEAMRHQIEAMKHRLEELSGQKKDR